MELGGAGSDAEGGDLAAAGGYVGEAGGAKAGEEAAEFAAKQIWSEVDQHVAELNGPVRRDEGKNFAANGDTLLHDPSAVSFRRLGGAGLTGGNWPGQRFTPTPLLRFPAARAARAALFLAWVYDPGFAVFPHAGEAIC